MRFALIAVVRVVAITGVWVCGCVDVCVLVAVVVIVVFASQCNIVIILLLCYYWRCYSRFNYQI